MLRGRRSIQTDGICCIFYFIETELITKTIVLNALHITFYAIVAILFGKDPFGYWNVQSSDEHSAKKYIFYANTNLVLKHHLYPFAYICWWKI